MNNRFNYSNEQLQYLLNIKTQAHWAFLSAASWDFPTQPHRMAQKIAADMNNLIQVKHLFHDEDQGYVQEAHDFIMQFLNNLQARAYTRKKMAKAQDKILDLLNKVDNGWKQLIYKPTYGHLNEDDRKAALALDNGGREMDGLLKLLAKEAKWLSKQNVPILELERDVYISNNKFNIDWMKRINYKYKVSGVYLRIPDQKVIVINEKEMHKEFECEEINTIYKPKKEHMVLTRYKDSRLNTKEWRPAYIWLMKYKPAGYEFQFDPKHWICARKK